MGRGDLDCSIIAKRSGSKGEARPLDLIKVVFESSNCLFLLSVTWSYIADVDVELEFLRFLEGWRFYLYGLWRLIRLKRYQGIM